MYQVVKTVIFWLLITVAGMLLWQVTKSSNQQRAAEISYSQFLSDVDAGNVARVRISNTRGDATYRDGSQFSVIVPTNEEQLLQTLRQKNVQVWYSETGNASASWLVNLAPFALIAALWFFMVRRLKARSQPPGPTVDGSSPWQSK